MRHLQENHASEYASAKDKKTLFFFLYPLYYLVRALGHCCPRHIRPANAVELKSRREPSQRRCLIANALQDLKMRVLCVGRSMELVVRRHEHSSLHKTAKGKV